MKIDCTRFKNRLVTYLEGEIPPEEKGGFDSHEAGCPSCKILADRSRLAYHQLLREYEVQVPPGLWLRILGKTEKKDHRMSLRVFFEKRLFPLAASLSLGAAVLLGLELGKTSPVGPASDASELHRVSFAGEYLSAFEDIPRGSLADMYTLPISLQQDGKR